MDFVFEDWQQIKRKIRQWKSECLKMREQNRELRRENALLKNELEKHKKWISGRQERISGKLLSEAVEEVFGTREQARKRMDEMISSIDKIIASLKNDE